MRWWIGLACLLVVAAPLRVGAQDAGVGPDAGAPAPRTPQEPDDEEPQAPPEEGAPPPAADDEGSPRLRRPQVEPLGQPPVGSEGEGGESSQPEPPPRQPPPPQPAEQVEPEEPSPGAADDLLRQAEREVEEAEDADEVDEDGFLEPETVLSLNGYFRVRTELQDTFFLGRADHETSDITLPTFSRWVPIDRHRSPVGGCSGPVAEREACGSSDRLRYANMRLRLEPTLSLSEDVKVHMQLDAFDNIVLGSTPQNEAWVPGDAGFTRAPGRAREPLGTMSPPSADRNSLRDSIRVRRAWAEVTNRGLGQLRFGRMGWNWGLGLLANDGAGIDSDFQTDVDRIAAITKIAGLYLMGAWDWAGSGYTLQNPRDLEEIYRDGTTKDDLRQFVAVVARRTSDDERRRRLARGDFVLDGGLTFIYRRQQLSASGFAGDPGITDPFVPPTDPTGVGDSLLRRGLRAFIPDLWGELRWGGLRIGAEAVIVGGNVRADPEGEEHQLLQFGAALESEYRLLDDKLGIHFYTGYATGDQDVNGLVEAPEQQLTADDRISTFSFHPNYRIDLILWRNIIGRVSGAYYFRPGVSYDLIRNPFGQLLGARADFIYSRASREVQTYGSDPNLGAELNLTAYYRSEDGPGPTDGFYAQFQYGILFPLAGLGYPDEQAAAMREATRFNGLDNAQTIRLILGVQY